MGLIIDGLFALCLILLVLWVLSLRGSITRDKAEAQERQQEAQEAAERAVREARLLRPGENLRCLGCEYSFLGPLPDTGCPRCHLAAMVISVGDEQAAGTHLQTTGFRRKEDDAWRH